MLKWYLCGVCFQREDGAAETRQKKTLVRQKGKTMKHKTMEWELGTRAEVLELEQK